ncbi:VWA domain-containing protein [Bacillus velezensis]
MDKLQEIISDLSLWHLASKEELKPLDINAGPCYIIEQSYVKDIMIGYMRKQQAIIEEHQRQQEVTVIQFRQAQEEIKRLTKENEELKLKVEEQAESIRDFEFENGNLEDEVEELQGKIEALEGAAE